MNDNIILMLILVAGVIVLSIFALVVTILDVLRLSTRRAYYIVASRYMRKFN